MLLLTTTANEADWRALVLCCSTAVRFLSVALPSFAKKTLQLTLNHFCNHRRNSFSNISRRVEKNICQNLESIWCNALCSMSWCKVLSMKIVIFPCIKTNLIRQDAKFWRGKISDALPAVFPQPPALIIFIFWRPLLKRRNGIFVALRKGVLWVGSVLKCKFFVV